jgi:hypothetical protein
MAEDEVSVPTACPKTFNKPPFFAFTMPLYLAFRGQTWPWVQNSGFSIGELHQEKMCPSGASHLQLVNPGWRGRVELVSPQLLESLLFQGSHLILPLQPASVAFFFLITIW